MVLFIDKLGHLCNQLVADGTWDMMRVEAGSFMLFLVWRADGLAIGIDDERDSLLEAHIAEL